ncbi:MAG: hypothetical protein IPO56_10405 [Flavobacteriales bacterium]|nr:hypothetical protein [Flavobacteriales bacterium]
MKTPTLCFLAFCASTCLRATVLTVSNEPGYPAQHNNIADAIAAASPGDTLLITGSAATYGTAILDKPLTLIGAGYNIAGAKTQLNGVFFADGSSGSKIIAMNAGQIYVDYGNSIGDILIERVQGSVAYFNGYPLDGLIIKNSFIGSINMSGNWTNVLITNNLITGQITSSSSPSVVISNNIFSNDGSYALQSLSHAVISNNIFYGSAPSFDGNGVANCAFNNNISYGSPDDDLPPTGSNVGAGNQVGVDPLFVNVPDFQGLASYDYHLQPGSPGINAGTDGTDIGIYGGSAPLVGVLDGVARIPLVTTFNLLNTSIGEGGSLNVQVQGTKHD